MDQKNNGDWKKIAGGILLIVVLFAGVKLIFWGLEQAIPKGDTSYSVSAGQSAASEENGQEEAPSFCVHCGRELPESFQWGQFCPWCGKRVE